MSSRQPSSAGAPDQERASAGFTAPDLDAPIDVAGYVRACPASATTRGAFFQFVVELVEKERRGAPAGLFEQVGARRWVPWSSYPLVDFMHLAVNAAKILHPGRSLGEGLRRIGWLAYPSFASTMAGRVVLLAAGDDVEGLLQVVPKAYSVSLGGASASSRRIGKGHWEVALRNVYGFADSYQLGVLEGAVKGRGATPAVRLRVGARRSDVDFEVRW